MGLLRWLVILPVTVHGLNLTAEVGYKNFERSSVHKSALVKTLRVSHNWGNFKFGLLANEVNFENKDPVGDFAQAQLDLGGYYRSSSLLIGVGFHYLPYAKPQFSDNAKGIWIKLAKIGRGYTLSILYAKTYFRDGFRVNQISPLLKWKFKRRFFTFVGGDVLFYNSEGVFNVPAKSLATLKLGGGVNYPASKMRGFGWVCTLKGVPYHHGEVHTPPTPTYPAIQRDSRATFF